MTKATEPIFYTYIYLNPLKPGKYHYQCEDGFVYTFYFEPFYVGKGKDDRLYRHLSSTALNDKHNNIKNGTIKKILKENLEPYIFKIKDKLIEQEAFDLEIKLIKLIGRRILNTGTLANMTDGGDGCVGNIITEETKKKISKSNKGKKKSKQHCENISKGRTGIKFTDEHKKNIGIAGRNKPPMSQKGRDNMSKASMGHIVTEETREKIRIANTGSRGFKHTEESKRKIGEASKLRVGELAWNYGKHLSNIHKKKLSNAIKGSKSYLAKTFKFIDPNKNEYIICGGFDKFCKDHNLTRTLMQKYINNGRINKTVLKSRKCLYWEVIEIKKDS